MKKLIIILVLTVSLSLYSTIINIPADYSTIQEGINSSADTDTVLVQPNTYVENINYSGKNITVASLFLTTQDTTCISNTIIDGNSSFCVVTFSISEDSTAVLCGFTITNGGSFHFGGGICCYMYSSPSLQNVTITGNSASSGGGICCWNNSSPSLQNVTISGNYATSGGGGIYCDYYSSTTFINSTISNNSAINGGGIYCWNNSSLSLVNCIMWNDTPEEVYFDDEHEPNTITIAYSDIEGGEAGIVTNNNGTVNWLEGNIDEDPLFVDPANGDYHLTENSPCIDAGDPTSPLDPDGTIADMGAFYYHQVNDMDDNEIQIAGYHLSNHPNPFNPLTTISFEIKENETGILTIFNIKGQLIESYRFESGKHNYLWDASNLGSGIYLYKLQTESITETRKMLLLK